MTQFVLICALLAVVTLVWLLRPLLRKQLVNAEHTLNHTSGDELRSAQNLVIARERLDDLEQLHQAGSLSDDEYQQQRDDIERALASQLNVHATREQQPPSWLLGALIIIAIPAMSVGIYQWTGTPQAMDPVHQLSMQQATTQEDIENMVAGLAQRMETDKDNTQGWSRLAQSYMVLGRYPEALNAMNNVRRIEGDTAQVLSMFGEGYMVMQRYDEAAEAIAKLREIQGDTPELLLRHADAVAMQQDAQLAGDPENFILAALQQEPNNIRALWMAGMAARQRGSNAEAIDYWEKLQPFLTEEPRNLAELNKLIEETRAQLQVPGVSALPSAENADLTPSTSKTTSDAVGVTVSVSLDASLSASAKPEETVFIFARATNGPRMPLAAHKTTVSQLPLTITLTDANAMMPQMTLSSVEQVEIVARVSRSGDPIPAPGDLQGLSAPLQTNSSPTVTLEINTVVE